VTRATLAAAAAFTSPLSLPLPVDEVRLTDDVKRLVQLVAGDLLSIYVQPGAERPVQDTRCSTCSCSSSTSTTQ